MHMTDGYTVVICPFSAWVGTVALFFHFFGQSADVIQSSQNPDV